MGEERLLQVARRPRPLPRALRRLDRRAVSLCRGHEARLDLRAHRSARCTRRSRRPRSRPSCRSARGRRAGCRTVAASARHAHGHRPTVDLEATRRSIGRHARTFSSARRTSVSAASRRYAAGAADVVDWRQAREVLRARDSRRCRRSPRDPTSSASSVGQPLRDLRARPDRDPRPRDPPIGADLRDRRDHRDRDHQVRPRAELLERRPNGRALDRRGNEQPGHELVGGPHRPSVAGDELADRHAPLPRIRRRAPPPHRARAGSACRRRPARRCTHCRPRWRAPGSAGRRPRAPPRAAHRRAAAGPPRRCPSRSSAHRCASRRRPAATPRSPAMAVTSSTSSTGARPTRAG